MLYVHTEEDNNVILGRKFIHYKFISYYAGNINTWGIYHNGVKLMDISL
jgi:hypothetical protein